MLHRKLLVIDVETTGLATQADSIIELAACVLEPENLREVAHFHSHIATTTPISPNAFRVHGITAQALTKAPALRDVICGFEEFAPKDALLCGHNVAFDAAFLKEAHARANIAFNYDYHLVDIWSIAFFVLGARGIRLPSYNLNALCSLYGIERAPQHSALQDVRASAAILRHLGAAVKGSTLEVLGQFNLFR